MPLCGKITQQHAFVLEQALYCLFVKTAPPAAVCLPEFLLYVYQKLVQRPEFFITHRAVSIAVMHPARHLPVTTWGMLHACSGLAKKAIDLHPPDDALTGK